MSSSPRFVSPIIEDPTAAGGAATVTDRSELSKLVVKTTWARPDGIGPAFGSSEAVGDAFVCGTRPGEWTIIGPAEATASAVAGTTAHVVDLTHGRVMIEVAGPSASSAMEKVCSLDWSDDMMPDGSVASASVAKVSCDIIRRDGGDRAYWILADRSYGQYLYDALVDSATEFR